MSAQVTGLAVALGCALISGAQLGIALRGWGKSQSRVQTHSRAAFAFALCVLNAVVALMALEFLPMGAMAHTDWQKGVAIAAALAPQWLFAVAVTQGFPFLTGEKKMALPAWLRRLASDAQAKGESAGE